MGFAVCLPSRASIILCVKCKHQPWIGRIETILKVIKVGVPIQVLDELLVDLDSTMLTDDNESTNVSIMGVGGSVAYFLQGRAYACHFPQS